MAVLSLLAACDGVVAAVRPTVAAHQRRSSILEYMTNLVRRSLGAAVFATGSFSLLTYLPDGEWALIAAVSAVLWGSRLHPHLCTLLSLPLRQVTLMFLHFLREAKKRTGLCP